MKATPVCKCPVCGRENFLCSDLSSAIKTTDQVKTEFRSFGIAITHWAKDHGVHQNSVNEVINGRKRCVRGDAHAIAVLLRLKDGDIAEFLNAKCAASGKQ